MESVSRRQAAVNSVAAWWVEYNSRKAGAWAERQAEALRQQVLSRRRQPRDINLGSLTESSALLEAENLPYRAPAANLRSKGHRVQNTVFAGCRTTVRHYTNKEIAAAFAAKC